MDSATLIWIFWALSGFFWFRLYRPSIATAVCTIGSVVIVPSASPSLRLYIGDSVLDYQNFHSAGFAVALGILTRVLYDHSFRSALCLRGRQLLGPKLCVLIPVVVYCICPIGTVVSNQLAYTECITLIIGRIAHVGIVYAAGLLFLSTAQSRVDLLIVSCVFGVVCIVPCFYETIVGPQYYIQVVLFGEPPPDAGHAQRMWGWRPQVMFANGIRLGRWMVISSLCFLVLTTPRLHRNYLGSYLSHSKQAAIHVLLSLLMYAASICTKSFSWIYLLVLSTVAILLFPQLNYRKTGLIIASILIVTLTIMANRIAGTISYNFAIVAIEPISERAANSLKFRAVSEDVNIGMTREYKYWLFGDYGVDGRFKYPYYSDQRYVMEYKGFGLIGLVAWAAVLVIPVMSFSLYCFGFSKGLSSDAILSAFALFVALVFWDCLFNAFINPFFYLCASGLLTSCRQLRGGKLLL